MENHVPNSTEQGVVMCLNNTEDLLLGNSVMGRKVTLLPVVLGPSSRLRKQSKPLSHPLEQMLAKRRKPRPPKSTFWYFKHT